MHTINGVTTTLTGLAEDDTITVSLSPNASTYITGGITVDTSTPPLIVRDENGENHDILAELKEIKQYVKVLEEACDTLLAEARKDTTIAEMLDKHEFIRKLSQ